MSQDYEAEYRKLKQRVEDREHEAAVAQGAQEQLITTLKKEFDCADLEEARDLLAELQDKEETLGQKFQKELKAYQRKWDDGDRSHSKVSGA